MIQDRIRLGNRKFMDEYKDLDVGFDPEDMASGGIARAGFGKGKLAKGLGLAILVHGVYDYFLFLGQGTILSIVALLIAISYGKKAIKLPQQDSKARNI